MEKYENKYLKYKYKYLHEKQKLTDYQFGGRIPLTQPPPIPPLTTTPIKQLTSTPTPTPTTTLTTIPITQITSTIPSTLTINPTKQIHLIEEEKEYRKIFERLCYDYSHHLHRLIGFYSFDTDEYIEITKIVIKKIDTPTFTVNPITKFDLIIKLFIESYLKHNLLKLKKFPQQNIIFDTISFDDLISLIRMEKFNLLTFHIEIKLYNFTQLTLQGGCPPYDGKKHIKGLIGIYSEPIIQYIHGLCSNFYNYTLQHRNEELKKSKQKVKYLFPFIYTRTGIELDPKIPIDILKEYYDNIVEKIKDDIRIGRRINEANKVAEKLQHMIENNEISFVMFQNRTYKQDIMINHIISHSYAHNGINRVELIKQAGRVILPDQLILKSEHLDFLHSYLHTLDMFNMIKYELIEKNMTSYNLLLGCFSKSIYHICYEKIIKSKQFTFLDPHGNIIQEAIEDKIRQYELELRKDSKSSELNERYHYQLTTKKIMPIPKLSQSQLQSQLFGFDSYKILDLQRKYPKMIEILKPLLQKEIQYKDFKTLIKTQLREYKIPKSELLYIVKLLPSYINSPQIVYDDDDDDDNKEFVLAQTDV